MKKIGPVFLIALQTLLLTGITLIFVLPVSCNVSEEGIQIISGDYSAPVIEEVKVLDERSLKINFSEKVKVTGALVSKFLPGITDSMEHSENENLSPGIAAVTGESQTEAEKIEVSVVLSDDEKTAFFNFAKECEVGKTYVLFGEVQDTIKNSLTFSIPFLGFNSRVPKVLMSELQIKYGTGKKNGKTVYRSEFVELVALSSGNLGGLEIVSASDGEVKKYELPAVEVRAGEVLVVHLRTAGEGCISETENLNEAFGEFSAADVRDIWSTNTTSRLNDKSDVIVLRNGIDGSLLDAFMYCEEDSLEWKKGVSEFADAAFKSGIYESSDIGEAFCVKGTTPLNSFQRINALEIKNSALAGTLEFPVKNSSSFWKVDKNTPGILFE